MKKNNKAVSYAGRGSRIAKLVAAGKTDNQILEAIAKLVAAGKTDNQILETIAKLVAAGKTDNQILETIAKEFPGSSRSVVLKTAAGKRKLAKAKGGRKNADTPPPVV